MASAYADRLGRLEAGKPAHRRRFVRPDQRARFPEPRPLYDPDGAAGLDGLRHGERRGKGAPARRRDFGDFGRLKGTNDSLSHGCAVPDLRRSSCLSPAQRAASSTPSKRELFDQVIFRLSNTLRRTRRGAPALCAEFAFCSITAKEMFSVDHIPPSLREVSAKLTEGVKRLLQ